MLLHGRWLLMVVIRCLALWLAVLLGGCAEHRIRESAREYIAQGEYEQGLRLLQEGVADNRDSVVLRSGLIQARAEVQAKLAAEAAHARAEGDLDQAQTLLARALALEPQNKRMANLLADLRIERRQNDALLEARELVEKKQIKPALALIDQALRDSPRHAGLLQLKRQVEVTVRQQQWRIAQRSLAETRPVSLDFRDAPLRTVLDALSRNSGINFIFDKDMRTDVRSTVFIHEAKVEDALDLITSTNQLAKKVIDPKTVVIYQNTPDKQREYQELVLRVFYLETADVKGAAAFLRSMLKLRDPFIDERTNMLALRDTQDNIELAERLISLYDAGEPEVLLEVEVLEVSASRLTELGVKYPDTFSLTPLSASGAAGSGLTLESLRGLGSDRIGVGISGLIVNLKREVGDVTTLANPKIRARNKEKAKILIGDKIPVVTTTAGNSGFVAESVSYLDVGLKLDVEPTVFPNDEVAIAVAMEVSSLGAATKTSTGSIAYRIGTRTASTLLRLRDGETQLLAGLISKDERATASRVPGLGDLPLLGRLFSSQQDSSAKTELVLAITPRVLRNIRRPDSSETELWIGTEAQPRLRPVGGLKGSGSDSSSEVPAPQPTSPVQGGVVSADKPAQAEELTIRWAGPTQVKVGDVVDVQVVAKSAPMLRGLPMTLTMPTNALALSDVLEGDFFRRDGEVTSFIKSGVAGQPDWSVGILRNTATGQNGEGTVLTLRFRAKEPGEAQLVLKSANPIGVSGPVSAPSLPPPWSIKVLPAEAK